MLYCLLQGSLQYFLQLLLKSLHQKNPTHNHHILPVVQPRIEQIFHHDLIEHGSDIFAGLLHSLLYRLGCFLLQSDSTLHHTIHKSVLRRLHKCRHLLSIPHLPLLAPIRLLFLHMHKIHNQQICQHLFVPHYIHQKQRM